jgi:restriction system protein
MIARPQGPPGLHFAPSGLPGLISMVFDRYPPLSLSPEEFEEHVRKMLDASGAALSGYQSAHRDNVVGSDGDYEIDITVRFSALGAEYFTLIECKRHTASIKRKDVQTLWAKIQSTGAHKGMIFATSGFQSGAVEFAKEHGIALVTVADGRSSYLTRAASGSEPIPWSNVPEFISKVVGWLQDGSAISLISEHDARALGKAIGLVRN